VVFLSDRQLERMRKSAMSGRIIPYLAAVTATVTILAALAVRLLARGEFGTFGESIWWAAQTVTTVGYGDVIPSTAFSKVIAVLVMFFGIATLSLTTAVVTSIVMSSSHERSAALGEDPYMEALLRIEERLEALEQRLLDAQR
jgi:voltage-gated potassium channel